MVALSEELGNFIDYVGGPSFGHVLLSPLENLAAIEEPVVRDKVRKYRICDGRLTHLPPGVIFALTPFFLGCRIVEQDLRKPLSTAG